MTTITDTSPPDDDWVEVVRAGKLRTRQTCKSLGTTPIEAEETPTTLATVKEIDTTDIDMITKAEVLHPDTAETMITTYPLTLNRSDMATQPMEVDV